MLTEHYVEALLVDEELADMVWEAWDSAEISDQAAVLLWTQFTVATCDCGARLHV